MSNWDFFVSPLFGFIAVNYRAKKNGDYTHVNFDGRMIFSKPLTLLFALPLWTFDFWFSYKCFASVSSFSQYTHCVVIYRKCKTRSCAPENQSSAANRTLICCPLVLFGLPEFLTSSSAPLALLLLSIVSASKRRGCGEVRAEGGRVKLCHQSAEVLVHIERTGRDTGKIESLDYHHIVALMSFPRSFKLPSMRRFYPLRTDIHFRCVLWSGVWKEHS